METKMFLLLPLVLTLLTFSGSSSAQQQQQSPRRKKNQTPSLFTLSRIGSSAVFPVRGNVYPDGYFYVAVGVGNPAKPYFLDIDTGSDLTWIQCDAPCVRCNKAPHPPYRPNRKSLVPCSDPICVELNLNDENHKCDNPKDQCDYEIEYADRGFSLGVLIKDAFPLRLSNGSVIAPRLAIGCGYDQEVPENAATSNTDGVLGLGNGDTSIVAQLRKLGITRNVIGHCISRQGIGYLFLGDDLVPSSGVAWTSMYQSSSSDKHYSPGLAELSYGTKSTGVKGLLVILDSGSSYTYFNVQAYQAFISSVRKDLNGKPLTSVDDKTLPVCWKGSKPFKSVQDVKNFFTPVTLTFGKYFKKSHLVIPPENYLIITSNGNVCLGILNGGEVGLENLNLIGDISLQDLLVIYDNEKHQIGWAPKDCNRLPNVEGEDEDEDSFQPYTPSMETLTEEDDSASNGEL